MKNRKAAASHLLYEILNIPPRKAGTIAYAPPLMAQFGLPTRDLKINEFVRYNGQYKFVVLAPTDIGLPHGIYPRNTLVYLATEVRLTQSKFVDLGLSSAAFKKKLGIGIGAGKNGPSNRFNEQFRRLFSCSVKVIKDTSEYFEAESHNFSRKASVVWKATGDLSMTGVLELEASFYESLVSRSFPIDRRVLKFIGGDCLSYDLYLWLTFRVFSLKKPVLIQWLQLQIQFGNQLASRHSFVNKFKKALNKIRLVWPELMVIELDRGILLKPSTPHVRPDKGDGCV